jgi:hypothetical protein
LAGYVPIFLHDSHRLEDALPPSPIDQWEVDNYRPSESGPLQTATTVCAEVTNRIGATVRVIKGISTMGLVAAAVLAAHGAAAQSVTNVNALQGLVPVTTLGNTDAGRAALASNLTVTSDIQSGAANQPLLLSFPDQQQQALRDAFITGVAYELADGLGNKLGDAYQATVSIRGVDDCKTSDFTSMLPAVNRVISFANATSHADSDAGKYFFANETRDGTEPVSVEALAILTDVNGTTDAFGKAYDPPACTAKADPCCCAKVNPPATSGRSRPSHT